MQSDQKTVVIVDDEFLIALDLKNTCERLGIRVLGTAANEPDAVELIERSEPEYVLMDVRIRGKRDGVEAAINVHEKLPSTKIIFITGSNEPPTLRRIQDDNPYRVLIKPVSEMELKEAFGL
jgi:DNA-binding NarL/FixJ family response regulator